MKKPEFTEDRSFRDIIIRQMIERKHKKVMVDKYWNLPEFKKDYQYQLRGFAKLIKVYSKSAILSGIEKEKWCWSLNSPKLQESINEEQQKIDRELNRIANQQESTNTVKLDSANQKFRRKKKDNFKDG